MKIRRRWIFKLSIIIISIFSHLSAVSQLYINEFMASNSETISDPDYHDYSDWIEIYNAGSNSISLFNYYLTDNLSNPDKWQITSNITIGAGEYILLWADDYAINTHASFKLSKDGEEIGLYDNNLNPIDSIIYPEQLNDHSMGRYQSDINAWKYYKSPTPGEANNTRAFDDFISSVPDFSSLGGIYNESLSLTLQSRFGGIIMYTLDGSTPTRNSNIYKGSIPITATTIVRARLIKDNQIDGPVVTHTYFLDQTVNDIVLPIVSLVSDPGNFWSQDSGIYVQNFKPEWEIPVNIEFFENDGSDRAGFNTKAGVKVNGLNSWELPQKMLGVYFRGKYESGSIDYPLIFENNHTKYGNFALRVSGSDWSFSMCRDAAVQTATSYNMNVSHQGYRGCVVFINGEYMGIHNIREKIDDEYIENTFSIESGTYDLIENANYVEEGSLNQYQNFKALYSKDLSNQANFDAVAEVMDIEDFTDYMATEIGLGNGSITHNVMAWKPKEYGKWKWILMDLDRTFGLPELFTINYYLKVTQFPFKQLFNNTSYRHYFGRRLADHLYTTFSRLHFGNHWVKIKSAMNNDMPRQIERWKGTSSSYGTAIRSMEFWEDRFPLLISRLNPRQLVLLNDLSNYGFNGYTNFNLQTFPCKQGQIELNGLKVPFQICKSYHLKDEDLTVKAVSKSGYNFIGWAVPDDAIYISKNASWKYYDKGGMSDKQWTQLTYDDSNWSTGSGEFGYGDGDEATVIGYGGVDTLKHITSYFRKSFSLSADDFESSDFYFNMLCDDGAVVYLNGEEIARYNIIDGSVDSTTTPNLQIDYNLEKEYIPFPIENNYLKPGENIISVEVHQKTANSDDLSFALELIKTSVNKNNLLSTNSEYTFNLSGPTSLVAVYESTGECIVPEKIESNYTITSDCSPALITSDLFINEDATLTIESGVEIQVSKGVNIYVKGHLVTNGMEAEPVLFTINPDNENEKWGAMIFTNPIDTSYLNYTIIEGASEGPIPTNQNAAISAFNANLILDHITIENVYSNPIAARYSDITLLNSKLHSDVTGDLINVKYGKGYIENCEFIGSNKVDADAIDYDDVENGVIRNCKIYNFKGYNNDAIDIGEKTTNVQIDSLLISNIVDKGISFGQQSSGTVKHCTFVNCDMGLGIKDSCQVNIDYCSFYNVNIPVSCYEKNRGRAGGNGYLTNSILSNSVSHAYYSDNNSTISVSNCISDTDTLPEGNNNLFGNPLFIAPTYYNFGFDNNSPCTNSSNDNGALGSQYQIHTVEPSLMISKINYNPSKNIDMSEFLAIRNPSDQVIDLTGVEIDIAVNYTFLAGESILPDEEIYLVRDSNFTYKDNIDGKCYVWTSGKLADEGETILLKDENGIILDHVTYQFNDLWHSTEMMSGKFLSLKDVALDNHFAVNWEALNIDDILSVHSEIFNSDFTVYPNPSNGIVHISIDNIRDKYINIYSLTGILLESHIINNRKITLDLSDYQNQLLLLKIGNKTQKVSISNI